jgi:uncharacterized LabA/DUF88 family protein
MSAYPLPSGGSPSRVIAYIDGFNLYHGLRDAGYRSLYWLDMTALARNLLKPDQELVFTKYFTARIAGPKPADSPAKQQRLYDKRLRQNAFLDVLNTVENLKIYEGHYLAKDCSCRVCGARWTTHEEKMTYVRIATELLTDAFQNAFDVALLISADSDLTPPALALREFFPEKRIVAVFPPRRSSVQLKRAAHASFTIGRGKLKQSQFPDAVRLTSGHVLNRPDRWK